IVARVPVVVIMMTIPHIAIILTFYVAQWPFQPERQQGLGRDVQFSPARCNLCSGSTRGTGSSADGRSFATAGYCSDDTADDCAAAHILRRALITTHAFSSSCVVY